MKYIIPIIFVLFSCTENTSQNKEKNQASELDGNNSYQDTLSTSQQVFKEPICKVLIDSLEMKIIESGLVNIKDIDSSILVELKYSTTDNFIGVDVYGSLINAYLQPDVADKLAKAQSYLKETDSTLSLLIYDAVRPRSVQQIMWDTLDMPLQKKVRFVSNPKNGSIHNFGAAVDITVAKNGIALDMGTPFDDSSLESWPIREKQFLKEGKLTEQQVNNRKTLRRAMGKAGFYNIQSEWWHFNSCNRNKAKQLYKVIE